MVVLLLLVVLAAPPRACPPQATGTETGLEKAPDAAPGQRVAIAGLKGIMARSTLRWVDSNQTAVLETSYAFPDRCRWSMETPPDGHRLLYRFGTRAWVLQEPPSVEIEGSDRDSLFASMELRRALLLWPHGLEWRDDGAVRAADLGALGRLEARLENGLPVELALWRDERRIEAFTSIRWGEEHDGRPWPTSARLSNGEQPVWDERFERVGAETLIDEVFLPSDQQPERRSGKEAKAGLTELPARATLRIALPAPEPVASAWSTGRDLHRKHAQELAASGLHLDARLALELAADARVTAVVLRLAGSADSPPDGWPEGWSVQPGGPAWSAFLPGVDQIDAAQVAKLSEGVVRGERPGKPFALVEVEKLGRVQLVLPLAIPR